MIPRYNVNVVINVRLKKKCYSVLQKGIDVPELLLWLKSYRCRLEGAFPHVTLGLLYSHRVEVLHTVGCESSGYLYSGGHTCQRMPIAHRFAHGHYVGTETLPLQLESPEVTPHTSKACLHLICHKHSTG